MHTYISDITKSYLEVGHFLHSGWDSWILSGWTLILFTNLYCLWEAGWKISLFGIPYFKRPLENFIWLGPYQQSGHENLLSMKNLSSSCDAISSHSAAVAENCPINHHHRFQSKRLWDQHIRASGTEMIIKLTGQSSK